MLIRQAREVNDSKPEWVVDKVAEFMSDGSGKTIAILGLAFKANIDDLRESPALKIAGDVAAKFSQNRILVAEPNISTLPTTLSEYSNVSLMETEEAVATADVVLLLVDHDEFKNVDSSVLAEKEVVDTKGIWR